MNSVGKLRYNHPQLFKTVLLYICWAAYTGLVVVLTNRNVYDTFCGVLLLVASVVMTAGLYYKYWVVKIGLAITLGTCLLRVMLFSLGVMNQYRFYIVIGFWVMCSIHILIILFEPPKNPLTQKTNVPNG
jgi:hypothetical protein